MREAVYQTVPHISWRWTNRSGSIIGSGPPGMERHPLTELIRVCRGTLHVGSVEEDGPSLRLTGWAIAHIRLSAVGSISLAMSMGWLFPTSTSLSKYALLQIGYPSSKHALGEVQPLFKTRESVPGDSDGVDKEPSVLALRGKTFISGQGCDFLPNRNLHHSTDNGRDEIRHEG
jgi:hypothetical protein